MIGRTNTGGGGGGGLNFQVVGNPQPSKPKENTIWLNTDIKVTGYDFNATEPENPVQGMAWISIGTESAVKFNALKKNGLQVYPISAKQYISGAWVYVTAKSYQDGKWVNWIKKLFTEGEGEKVDFTIQNYKNGSVSVSNNGVIVNYTSTTDSGVWYGTTEKHDVNNYSEVVFDVKCTKNNGNGDYCGHFGIKSSNDFGQGNAANWILDESWDAVGHFVDDGIRREYFVPIPTVLGEFYIVTAGVWGGTIYNIFLR